MVKVMRCSYSRSEFCFQHSYQVPRASSGIGTYLHTPQSKIILKCKKTIWKKKRTSNGPGHRLEIWSYQDVNCGGREEESVDGN